MYNDESVTVSAFKDLSLSECGGGSHVNRQLERNMAGAEAKVGTQCHWGIQEERESFT